MRCARLRESTGRTPAHMSSSSPRDRNVRTRGRFAPRMHVHAGCLQALGGSEPLRETYLRDVERWFRKLHFQGFKRIHDDLRDGEVAEPFVVARDLERSPDDGRVAALANGLCNDC